MTDSTDNLDGIFDSMVRQGLLSTGNGWLESAIQQKNPLVTLDLANSDILVYDLLDRVLLQREIN